MFISLLQATPAQANDPAIGFVKTAETNGKYVLDIRQAEACEKASLPGARCLPVRDILAPNKRLPNISGLLWLLGTIGLTGNEHILLVGDNSRKKAFAAGLLFIAGQKRISILEPRFSDFKPGRREPGTSRSKTREQVFQTPMRSDNIILRSELSRLITANDAGTIVDLRTEAEYWSQVLRTPRGGHIPGAILAGTKEIKLDASTLVVYGHRTYEGLAGLTNLVASGINARVLMEGWAGWAADGALPVDSITFADPVKGQRKPKVVESAVKSNLAGFLIAGFVIALGAFAAGFYASFLKSRKKA